MYTPAAFVEDRPALLHALIDGARLGTLMSNGADGVPEVTVLPLLLDRDAGPFGTLFGHVARANPHAAGLAAAGRAAVLFQGVDAYVTPSSYASKAVHHRVVPTWNYEAVLADCTVAVTDDAATLHALVSRLTARHEARRAEPWAVTDAPERFVDGQLKGILGITLRIERLHGKRKLSQNRDAADRDGAAAALAASEDPRDRAAAAAMRGA